MNMLSRDITHLVIPFDNRLSLTQKKVPQEKSKIERCSSNTTSLCIEFRCYFTCSPLVQWITLLSACPPDIMCSVEPNIIITHI